MPCLDEVRMDAVLYSSLEVHQERPVPQDLAQVPHLPGRDVGLGDEVCPGARGS